MGQKSDSMKCLIQCTEMAESLHFATVDLNLSLQFRLARQGQCGPSQGDAVWLSVISFDCSNNASFLDAFADSLMIGRF